MVKFHEKDVRRVEVEQVTDIVIKCEGARTAVASPALWPDEKQRRSRIVLPPDNEIRPEL